MADYQFNAEEHEPFDGFETIPAGDYTASIITSEIKAAKKGRGTYLELVWEVLDGDFKQRRVWQRIMITHPSEKCVAMGQRKLSSVCHALGVMQLNDSSELHGIPTTIHVIVKEESGYDPSNEIGRFPDAKRTDDSTVPF